MIYLHTGFYTCNGNITEQVGVEATLLYSESSYLCRITGYPG
jgi:hypothetical protein